MKLVAENRRLLAQGLDVLRRLDRSVYEVSPPLGIGTVGQQLRHCLEFYDCFLDGLGAGRIDYDARQRDERIETDPERGVAVLEGVVEALDALPPGVEGRPLVVLEGSKRSAEQASSVGRELQFLSSHAVHHWALIAALLRQQGIEPGEEFGVAPSTLEHRRALVDS